LDVKALAAAAGAALAIAACGSAQAKDWTVKMLNRGSDGAMMAFEPAFLKISPGDAVTFVPVDRGHNAQTVPGMTPPGAQGFKGAIDQQLTVRLSKPGLYGYVCLPHAGIGMVGLIQVGAPVNKAQASAAAGTNLVGMGKKRMSGLLANLP
jgi:pseudoazurin